MYKERKKTEQIVFKRLLKIYFIFSFLFLSKNIFSEEINLVDINYISKKCFLNSNFIVEVKINERHKDYKKIYQNPKLVFSNESLKLIDSKVTSVYSGIFIKNTYQLVKTGRYNLRPILKNDTNQIFLSNIFINILPPKLSEKTTLKWVILSNDTLEIQENIYQGNKYLILLMGLFYNDKNIKWNVNFTAPENAILEIHKDILTSNEKQILQKLNKKNWNIIDFFYWTPIKKGIVSLPKGIINIKSKIKKSKKINFYSKKILVKENINKITKLSIEEVNANKSLELALRKKTKQQKDKKLENFFYNFNKKREIAKKIVYFRTKESSSFLLPKEKNKRIKLEKELGINKSFSSPSYLIKKITISIIFLIIYISLIIIFFKTSKKRKSIIFLVTALIIFTSISSIIYMYFLKQNKYKIAVYIPKNIKSSFYIYHIPEKTGSILDHIKIGETVFIKQETGDWIYIEKNNGILGWQKKNNFIICD